MDQPNKVFSEDYRKFVRLTGFIDMGLFTALALPLVSTQVLSLLFNLGTAMGDLRPVPNLEEPFVMLTINLVGVFGLFSAWMRISNTSGNLGPPTGVLKFAASAVFGLYIFIFQAPLVLLLFLVVDLITGIQLLVKKKLVEAVAD